MSAYFDALIRSSGMTIGRLRSASTQFQPASIDVDVDRRTPGAEANAVRLASPSREPVAPPRISDDVELPPARVPQSVDRRTHVEPDRAPAGARGAPEPAVDAPEKPSALPMESAKPDLEHALVRAAMRWVAAGTPQGSPVSSVGPVDDVAQGVARRQQSVPAVDEQTSIVAAKPLHQDDGGAQSEGVNDAPATPAPPKLPAGESIAAKPVPIRASLVTPPLPPQVAPPVRDEIVEVSIGAIHVRVDAPPQTVARPALTPAAGSPAAAPSRPARSALSRRALRRI